MYYLVLSTYSRIQRPRGGRKVRARKLHFSVECAEAAYIFGESSSRAEYVQNLSAIAFDTAENEFRQVCLPFFFENAVNLSFAFGFRFVPGMVFE